MPQLEANFQCWQLAVLGFTLQNASRQKLVGKDLLMHEKETL